MDEPEMLALIPAINVTITLILLLLRTSSLICFIRGSGCALSLVGSAGAGSSRIGLGVTGSTGDAGPKLLAFTSDTDVTVTNESYSDTRNLPMEIWRIVS